MMDSTRDPSTPNPLPMILIGAKWAKSPLSKIKVDVVHVGHSPQPDPCKVCTSLTTEISISQNSNSSIVPEVMEIMDAMVDS